jgi:predicted transcriptional regulator YdeE
MRMTPEVFSRRSFNVLGVQSRIDPLTADYGTIWEEQFSPHHAFVRELAVEAGYYGVYFASPAPGQVDFIAGMAVGDVESYPAALVLRTVSAGQYAVFQCSMDAIGPTWQAIYNDWLANSGVYAEDETRASFEYFPPGVEEGKAPVSINVPLKAK